MLDTGVPERLFAERPIASHYGVPGVQSCPMIEPVSPLVFLIFLNVSKSKTDEKVFIFYLILLIRFLSEKSYIQKI
jgi:hypothetical protein